MKTVMIVEDDDISRLTLDINLKSFFRTICIADEKEALEAYEREDVDVVLMDINLGSMMPDGISVMKGLKEKFPEKSEGVKFVALTAYSQRGDKEKFIAEGFDSYLSKPVDFDALSGFISKITDDK